MFAHCVSIRRSPVVKFADTVNWVLAANRRRITPCAGRLDTKNCRASVEMIAKYYAAYLNTGLTLLLSTS